MLQVKTILLDRRKKWFNHVNFTGWEPTLFPRFLELLKFAKKLGYKIYVGTNGTLFAWEPFAQEALSYIDEVSLSIHWFDEKSCDEQIKLKNHFNIYKDKIAVNINKYKQNNFFFSNVVINQSNYRDTLKIIKFINESEYPVKQILVSNIAPEWLADVDFQKLVFDLNDFKNYIPEIIEYCDSHNLILRFFWLPTCILWENYMDYANDAHWEERHTIERYTNKSGNIVLQDIYSPDNSRKRTFVDTCNNCKWKANPCTGVFKKYLENYDF